MSAEIMAVGLNRAEGPMEQCYAVIFTRNGKVPQKIVDSKYFKKAKLVLVTGDIGMAVHAKLVEWGVTAPDPEKHGGYDKTDFVVVWENGESYAGRFDMQKGGRDGGVAFWDGIKRRIQYLACSWRPAHFNDAHWAYHCEMAEKEGWKAGASKMLAECYLPAV